MRRSVLLGVMPILMLLLPARAGEEPLQGFTQQSSAAERDWESKFRAIPSAENLREYMQRLTARPHHVGSPYDKDNAEWILSKFKEWGWDAHIETFDVLFPTPKERLVELVEPTKFTAKLAGAARCRCDPTSGQHDEQLPSYNAYSIDGDVTAPLVLCELRHAGGLRRTGSPGRLREGRHRHCALWQFLARHQAQGRGRAWRHRLPDLFRSARRRLFRGRRFPEGPDAARKACSAAA